MARLLPAGDRVLVAEYGDRIDEAINIHVHHVARALDRLSLPGIVELVPTYRSLAIHFDPLVTDHARIETAVGEIDDAMAAGETGLRQGAADDTPGAQPGATADATRDASRIVEIPVVYGGEFGPDLPDVAAHARLAEADVVAVHAGGLYRVYMMGFTPGFPYLGGMSPQIATPRLASPRTLVPAGAVGIAGQQTGIYPTASPGGWRLIGRTPARLFDASRTPPTLVEAGDFVRFVPVSAADVVWEAAPAAAASGGAADGSRPGIEVIDGGMLTTVQDLGRVGFQRYGVPVAGAMDTLALRAANRLVGNPDGEAGLEMTLVGPALRFEIDTVVACAGADLQPCLNGHPVPVGRSIAVRAGDVLTFAGQRRGVRACLAVRGGIAVPLVLNSRSTYRPSRLGGLEGRALREGDRLPLGPASGAPGPVRRLPPLDRPPSGSPVTIRVLPGPQDDAFSDTGMATFFGAEYMIGAQSDRVGCRLEGPAIDHRRGADIVSDGTAFGSVQVSGDGLPIVLMADRGTTGGYTKIATVVSADLHLLAQASPGDRVRFAAVSAGAAAAALRERERWLEAILHADDRTGATAEDVYDEDTGSNWAADGMRELSAALDAGRTTAGGAGPGVRAGMNGLVIDVPVRVGQVVAERDTLAVIEAMKMQNPVRAPRAGRIARVGVASGDMVSALTVVAEYED